MLGEAIAQVFGHHRVTLKLVAVDARLRGTRADATPVSCAASVLVRQKYTIRIACVQRIEVDLLHCRVRFHARLESSGASETSLIQVLGSFCAITWATKTHL